MLDKKHYGKGWDDKKLKGMKENESVRTRDFEQIIYMIHQWISYMWFKYTVIYTVTLIFLRMASSCTCSSAMHVWKICILPTFWFGLSMVIWFCFYCSWKCQRPGHLAEDCLVKSCSEVCHEYYFCIKVHHFLFR